eukprot:196600_1
MHDSKPQQRPLSPQNQKSKYTTTNNTYHRMPPNALETESDTQSIDTQLTQSIGTIAMNTAKAVTEAINDFNAHTVFLDGDDGVQTLQQLYDKEKDELRTRPKKAKFFCGLTITAVVGSVVGLIIWLIHCPGKMCNGPAASGKLLTILSGTFALLLCICTIYNWNRGNTTSRLFAKGKIKRDALQFDKKDKFIKKIVFWVDYGLPDKTEKMSMEERDSYLHEGVVIMEPGTQFICRFCDLQEIGWSTVINQDAFEYYIILNYFDTKTQKIVTYKSDLAEDKYGNERVYQELQNVMKRIDARWLDKIQVSNHIKKKRWYKQYRRKQ